MIGKLQPNDNIVVVNETEIKRKNVKNSEKGIRYRTCVVFDFQHF